jgi:hypothetical protein
MLVAGDAHRFEAEAIRVGTPADRHEHHIRRERLRYRALEFQAQPVIGFTDAHELGAELKVDPRPGEHPLQGQAEFPIHVGHDMIENFDDGYLGAEALPHRPELEPDIAAADDSEPVWHPLERQRSGRRDDALLVGVDPG